MTDNLKLACAFMLNPLQQDMSECVGYSTTQKAWVVTRPSGRSGQVNWEALDRINLPRLAPPPQDWFLPSGDGWERHDICYVLEYFAHMDLTPPFPTIAIKNSVREQALQDPSSVFCLCSYTIDSSQMFLAADSKEWFQQMPSGRWVPANSLGQFPAPDVTGWRLVVDGSWQAANVFMVLEQLASAVTEYED